MLRPHRGASSIVGRDDSNTQDDGIAISQGDKNGGRVAALPVLLDLSIDDYAGIVDEFGNPQLDEESIATEFGRSVTVAHDDTPQRGVLHIPSRASPPRDVTNPPTRDVTRSPQRDVISDPAIARDPLNGARGYDVLNGTKGYDVLNSTTGILLAPRHGQAERQEPFPHHHSPRDLSAIPQSESVAPSSLDSELVSGAPSGSNAAQQHVDLYPNAAEQIPYPNAAEQVHLYPNAAEQVHYPNNAAEHYDQPNSAELYYLENTQLKVLCDGLKSELQELKEETGGLRRENRRLKEYCRKLLQRESRSLSGIVVSSLTSSMEEDIRTGMPIRTVPNGMPGIPITGPGQSAGDAAGCYAGGRNDRNDYYAGVGGLTVASTAVSFTNGGLSPNRQSRQGVRPSADSFPSLIDCLSLPNDNSITGRLNSTTNGHVDFEFCSTGHAGKGSFEAGIVSPKTADIQYYSPSCEKEKRGVSGNSDHLVTHHATGDATHHASGDPDGKTLTTEDINHVEYSAKDIDSVLFAKLEAVEQNLELLIYQKLASPGQGRRISPTGRSDARTPSNTKLLVDLHPSANVSSTSRMIHPPSMGKSDHGTTVFATTACPRLESKLELKTSARRDIQNDLSEKCTINVESKQSTPAKVHRPLNIQNTLVGRFSLNSDGLTRKTSDEKFSSRLKTAKSLILRNKSITGNSRVSQSPTKLGQSPTKPNQQSPTKSSQSPTKVNHLPTVGHTPSGMPSFGNHPRVVGFGHANSSGKSLTNEGETSFLAMESASRYKPLRFRSQAIQERVSNLPPTLLKSSPRLGEVYSPGKGFLPKKGSCSTSSQKSEMSYSAPETRRGNTPEKKVQRVPYRPSPDIQASFSEPELGTGDRIPESDLSGRLPIQGPFERAIEFRTLEDENHQVHPLLISATQHRNLEAIQSVKLDLAAEDADVENLMSETLRFQDRDFTPNREFSEQIIQHDIEYDQNGHHQLPMDMMDIHQSFQHQYQNVLHYNGPEFDHRSSLGRVDSRNTENDWIVDQFLKSTSSPKCARKGKPSSEARKTARDARTNAHHVRVNSARQFDRQKNYGKRFNAAFNNASQKWNQSRNTPQRSYASTPQKGSNANNTPAKSMSNTPLDVSSQDEGSVKKKTSIRDPDWKTITSIQSRVAGAPSTSSSAERARKDQSSKDSSKDQLRMVNQSTIEIPQTGSSKESASISNGALSIELIRISKNDDEKAPMFSARKQENLVFRNPV